MVRLPAEYQEVEYLESTGTQWIDTEYVPTTETWVDCEYGFSGAYTGEQVMLGSASSFYNANNTTGLTLELYNHNTWYCACGGKIFGAVLIGIGKDINLKHHAILTKASLSIDGNVNYSSANVTFDPAYPCYLYAINGYGTGAKRLSTTLRLYSVTFYEGDLPIRRFIPCYRKSDNEPGMYDTVSGTFYTNSGSGTFLMGDPVHYDTASLLERRRQILLNTPHIKTVSDSMASFKTDIATDLKGLKVYFSPVQEGTGDPSPDNVRPITGWDGVTVNLERDVHRLIPIDWKTVTYNGITREYLGNGKYHCYGTLTKAYSTDRIYFEPFTCSTENGRKIRFNNSVAMDDYTFRMYFNNDASNVEWWVFNSINRSTNNPYTSMAGKYINNFQMEFLQVGNYYDFTFQIEFTVLEAPISISFPQTIYGGYVDLLNCEVVERYATLILTGNENWGLYTSNDNEAIFRCPAGKPMANQANELSSHFVFNGQTHGLGHPNCFVWGSATGYLYIQVPKVLANDLAEFEQYLALQYQSNTPVIIQSIKSTPEATSLTPQTIKALKGINNIFSNANGNIEVSFYSH